MSKKQISEDEAVQAFANIISDDLAAKSLRFVSEGWLSFTKRWV